MTCDYSRMTQWVLDLFAGPGGWDVYDHELGLLTLRVENDKSARATATAAGFVNTHDDVMTYRQDRFFHGLKASPPCQTFSAAGNGKGRKDLDVVLANLHRVADGAPIDYEHFSDARTGLVLEPLRIIRDALYVGEPFRWVVMEQVPAVLPVWDEYAKLLAQAGYSVATGNLHAEQYGVPQTRKRAVLIASLDRTASLPVPTHSRFHNRNPSKLDDGVLPWVSMAESLGWDPHDSVGFPRRADSGETITIDGVDYRSRDLRVAYQPAFGMTEKVRSWGRVMSSGTRSNAARRSHDQPAPTFAFGHDSASYVWHDEDIELHEIPDAKEDGRASRVTVAEAAMLQTFPVDYPWQGTRTKQFQQIGNAIPPLLARAILREVL